MLKKKQKKHQDLGIMKLEKVTIFFLAIFFSNFFLFFPFAINENIRKKNIFFFTIKELQKKKDKVLKYVQLYDFIQNI